MDAESSVLGVVVAVVGMIGAVLVARVSNPGTGADLPHGHEDNAHHDTTTIEGLAQVVALQGRTISEQGQKIATLEQKELEHAQHATLQDRTIRALRRWTQALEEALRATGATVPDPHPEDAPLIRG